MQTYGTASSLHFQHFATAFAVLACLFVQMGVHGVITLLLARWCLSGNGASIKRIAWRSRAGVAAAKRQNAARGMTSGASRRRSNWHVACSGQTNAVRSRQAWRGMRRTQHLLQNGNGMAPASRRHNAARRSGGSNDIAQTALFASAL